VIDNEAAHALRDLVVAGTIAVRARLAEAGDAAVHEPRVDLAERLVVDAEAMLDVRAVVLDEDVGLRGQALEDLDASGFLRSSVIERLLRWHVLEIEPVAGEVVLALVLHLDHFRPISASCRMQLRERADSREC